MRDFVCPGEMRRGSSIVSVSVGHTRIMHFKHIKTKKRVDIELEEGSILIMHAAANKYWTHAIPKRALSSVPSARLNITFRDFV